MKCNRFRKLLIPYSEGSLSAERATALERHLAECDSCTRELEAITCTVDVLKKVEYPVFEPAFDLRSRVLAGIAEEKPARRSWWQTSKMQAYSAAMAGLLLVAVAGAGMWRMMERGVEVTHSAAVEHRNADTKPLVKQVAPAEKPAEQRRTPGVSPTIGTDKVLLSAPSAERVRGIGGQPEQESPQPPRKAVEKPLPSADSSLFGRGALLRGAGNRYEGPSSKDSALSKAPKSLGYGVIMDNDEEAGRKIYSDTANKPATPDRSQAMTRSMTQAAPGGTQTPAYGGYGGVPGPSAPEFSVNEAPSAAVGDKMGIGSVAKSAPTDSLAAVLNNNTYDFKTLDGMPAMRNSAVVEETPVSKDIADLEVKLRNFPTSVKTISELVTKYREAGRPRDEYNMAQRLTKLDPDNAGYWFSRAQAADRVPMPKTAQLCYERAIKLGLKGAGLDQARARVKELEAKHK